MYILYGPILCTSVIIKYCKHQIASDKQIDIYAIR